MTHHAGVRTRHVDEHRGVVGRQLVLAQDRRERAQHVAEHERHVEARGARKIFLQPLDALVGFAIFRGQVGGDESARFDCVRDQQAFPARRRAEIEHGFAGLRREQLDGQPRRGILQVKFSALQQRLDFRPVARRHFEEARPARRPQKLRRLFFRRAPARVDRRRLLVPLEQRACRLGAELREPAFHEPVRVRKIFRELLRGRVRGRRRPGERDGEFARDGVHQPRLGRARDRLRLLDRVMPDFRRAAFRSRRGRALDQLVAGDKQHRARQKPRRMRHEPRERGVEPAEMPHHAEHEVLAARAFGAGEAGRQRFEQRVDAFVSVQPPRHQPHRRWPGRGGISLGRRAHRRRRYEAGARCSVILTRGLTRLVIVRSTLRFRPFHTQS